MIEGLMVLTGRHLPPAIKSPIDTLPVINMWGECQFSMCFSRGVTPCIVQSPHSQTFKTIFRTISNVFMNRCSLSIVLHVQNRRTVKQGVTWTCSYRRLWNTATRGKAWMLSCASVVTLWPCRLDIPTFGHVKHQIISVWGPKMLPMHHKNKKS